MEKRSVLFWLFFIILLFINYQIYGFIYNYFIASSGFLNGLAILLFFIVVIPITAILADKLQTYSLEKGLEKSKNFKLFMTAVITIPVLILSIHFYLDYTERNLDDVIDYRGFDFELLGFTVDYNQIPESQAYEWVAYEKGTVEELLEFLSQYRVKKVYTDQISGQGNFEFVVHHNITNPTMVRVMNGRDILVGEDIYRVVDKSIDLEWIQEFSQNRK